MSIPGRTWAVDILDHLRALLKTVSNFLCLRLKKSISFSRLRHKYERNTAKKTANCAHRWVWHNLDLAIWGCHFQQDNPYRGPSINDEDYLVGSLTSEWVTRQVSDIKGKNQTQQSPFTKPYRLLTFMGGLSNYIIIFLSDCHILCKYKTLSELHIKFQLANAGHS